MSISVTVTCECGADEDIELFNGQIELPDGWHEDPDDEDVHWCFDCSVEKGLEEKPVYVPFSPERVTRVVEPLGFLSRCACGATMWTADEPKAFPVVCQVCQHLARPTRLLAS